MMWNATGRLLRRLGREEAKALDVMLREHVCVGIDMSLKLDREFIMKRTSP